MPTCPNGHQSGSDDWCEVCGHRMTGAGAPAGAVPPPPPPPPPPAYGYPGPGPGGPGPGPGPGGPGGPGAGPGGPGAPGRPGGFPGGDPNATAQAELCPQCRTPREANAPFCEECRFNFITGTATSYTPVAPPPLPGSQGRPGGPGGPGGPPPGLNLPPGFQSGPGAPPQAPQAPRPPDPFEYQGSRPSQVNRPAEPLPPEPPSSQRPPQGPPPVPQAFQQPSGPPPPPQAFHQPGPPPAPQPPAAPQPAPGGGGDDWMLPPPSQAQPSHPGTPQAPQAPQAPHAPQPPQPQPAPQQGWTAVVAPDREYFMAMMRRSGPEAAGLNLPAYSPEQRLPLTGNQVSIGRRRQSTGESPDIDLSVPPEDPGVSHQHAVLVHQPDGTWAVVDQNSTNGTTINGAEDPIQPYVPVPLKDGDRVHVGAWTTITVRRG
ncbi:FHA domain-containing protein [Streptomyces sp. NPDC015131]|uniref:FHA domain-containing protein n=1 Tax=Streptomyces sp. NPDC015131 TaxID=3364941 RepID=UPI0036FDC748